jgi:proline dehydrogenase
MGVILLTVSSSLDRLSSSESKVNSAFDDIRRIHEVQEFKINQWASVLKVDPETLKTPFNISSSDIDDAQYRVTGYISESNKLREEIDTVEDALSYLDLVKQEGITISAQDYEQLFTIINEKQNGVKRN